MSDTTKGPGEFLDVATLRTVMNQQKRPRIGGYRRYGDEFDDYFIPRRFPARHGMVDAITQQKAAAAVRTALAKGIPIEDQDMPDFGTSGFGAEPEPAESVDMLTAVRSIYGSVMPAKPILDFVGTHPFATIATFMLSVGVGAYLGGFIGARGIDVLKKKLGW